MEVPTLKYQKKARQWQLRQTETKLRFASSTLVLTCHCRNNGSMDTSMKWVLQIEFFPDLDPCMVWWVKSRILIIEGGFQLQNWLTKDVTLTQKVCSLFQVKGICCHEETPKEIPHSLNTRNRAPATCMRRCDKAVHLVGGFQGSAVLWWGPLGSKAQGSHFY